MHLVKLITCLVTAIAALKQVDSAPKNCDLASIFKVPKRNYDDLEILERSNFDSDTETDVEDNISKSLNVDQPKSFANAQVMLRFGGGCQLLRNNNLPCGCIGQCQCPQQQQQSPNSLPCGCIGQCQCPQRQITSNSNSNNRLSCGCIGQCQCLPQQSYNPLPCGCIGQCQCQVNPISCTPAPQSQIAAPQCSCFNPQCQCQCLHQSGTSSCNCNLNQANQQSYLPSINTQQAVQEVRVDTNNNNNRQAPINIVNNEQIVTQENQVVNNNNQQSYLPSINTQQAVQEVRVDNNNNNRQAPINVVNNEQIVTQGNQVVNNRVQNNVAEERVRIYNNHPKILKSVELPSEIEDIRITNDRIESDLKIKCPEEYVVVQEEKPRKYYRNYNANNIKFVTVDLNKVPRSKDRQQLQESLLPYVTYSLGEKFARNLVTYPVFNDFNRALDSSVSQKNLYQVVSPSSSCMSSPQSIWALVLSPRQIQYSGGYNSNYVTPRRAFYEIQPETSSNWFGNWASGFADDKRMKCLCVPQIPELINGCDCSCASCAKYIGELNELYN